MADGQPTSEKVLDAIRREASNVGRVPSRSEFIRASGITEYHILRHFASWNAAVQSAGLAIHDTNRRRTDEELLMDVGELARKLGRFPTRTTYRREGSYSAGVFDRRFGAWSAVPDRFRVFVADHPEWEDVVPLLPQPTAVRTRSAVANTPIVSPARHAKLAARPTYGDPIDFRGLRHAPVNEQGVVFLFGMVAGELGYLVEAVQAGFPDLEAKRQIDAGRWQRVRIEFEFESRNYRDHGHALDGCDVIVCWKHNWLDCPTHLEIVELCTLLPRLDDE